MKIKFKLAFLGSVSAGLVLFLSPLLEASWDVWSKTIVHLITLLALALVLLSRDNRLDFPGISGKQIYLPAALLSWLFIGYLSARIKFNAGLELHNWLNYILFFLIIGSFIRGGIVSGKVFNYSIAAALVMSIAGICQFAILRQSASATMVNPNIFAGYLIMAVPLAFYLMKCNEGLRAGRAGLFPEMIYYAVIALCLFCLLLTKSAGALFSLASALLIMRYRARGAVLILFSALVFLFFKSGNPELVNRYFWWKSCLDMAWDFPLTGAGLGGFELIYPRYRIAGLSSVFAHNFYLQLLAETGFIGLGLFVAVAVSFFARVKNPYIKTGLLACLIHNLFDYSLCIPANGILFWALLSAGAVPGEKEQGAGAAKAWTGSPLPMLILLGCLIIYADSAAKVYFAAEHLNKGEYLQGQRYLNLAEKEYLSAVKSKKDFHRAYEGLAYLYLEKYRLAGCRSDIMEALIELENALKYNPYNAGYCFRLAALYLSLGETRRSTSYIRRAIENDPAHVKMYLSWMKKNILRKHGGTQIKN